MSHVAPEAGTICFLPSFKTPKGRGEGPVLVVLPKQTADDVGFTIVAMGTNRSRERGKQTDTDFYSLRPTEFIAWWFRRPGGSNSELTLIRPYTLLGVTIDQALSDAKRGPAQATALPMFRRRLPWFLWDAAGLEKRLPPIEIDDENREEEKDLASVRTLERGNVVDFNGDLFLVVSNSWFNRNCWYPNALVLSLDLLEEKPPAETVVIEGPHARSYGVQHAALQTLDFDPDVHILVRQDGFDVSSSTMNVVDNLLRETFELH